MSDPTSLEQKPETTPQTVPAGTNPSAGPPPLESSRNGTVHAVIALSALALIACFFLPWIAIFLGRPSGFDLQQLPTGEAKLVWFIPLGGLAALMAVIAKRGVLLTSQFAGLIPFAALMYYYVRLGEGFFQALQIGAHLSLLFAAILFVAPRFLQKPQH